MNYFFPFDGLECLKRDGFARLRFELHRRRLLHGLDSGKSDVLRGHIYLYYHCPARIENRRHRVGPRPSSNERWQLGFLGGTAVCPSIIFVAPPHARLGDAES